MGTFFNHRNSYCTLRIIRLFIRRLQEIRNWFEHQRALAFYRSSILFVYNWSANQNAAPLADVRIIDFAHVVPTTDRDENYLEGLLNLIGYFRAYEKQLTETLHRQIQPI